MEDYTFSKSTCEKYTIRWGSYGWAVFTIDEATGLFNCQSDYGDYNYMWPNHGRKSFKHFILELARDTSYLLKKVSKREEFDYEETLKRWKLVIIDARRELLCNKRQARDAWDVITGLDDYSGSLDILIYQIIDSDAINDVWDDPLDLFSIKTDYSPQALVFANEVMPMFAEILRKEIESMEKEKAPVRAGAEKELSHLDCTINLAKVEPLVDRAWAEEVLERED